MNKIRNVEMLKIMFTFLFCLLALSGIAMAATDTVTINVNISISSAIEVEPATATFNLVTPGIDTWPDSLAFTITNVGSTNFTTMYASVNTYSTEIVNPLVDGVSTQYRAGGFVVLMNQTMLDASSSNWRFVGRQEWNLTSKPAAFVPDTDTQSYGYFGNNSKQYFWDLQNGTNTSEYVDSTSPHIYYCNESGAEIRIKLYPINGSSSSYDLSGGVTTYSSPSSQNGWGIFNPASTGPLSGYCVAANWNCTHIFIYQWDQDSPFDQCSGEWYLYNDAENKFKTNDQWWFNMTVWVPKGIPAGDTSSSLLTITAS